MESSEATPSYTPSNKTSEGEEDSELRKLMEGN